MRKRNGIKIGDKIPTEEEKSGITVLIFGQLCEFTGSNRVILEGVSSTDEAIAALKNLYPSLGNIKFLVAVGKKMITGNTRLAPNSEIALLPPFSGG